MLSSPKRQEFERWQWERLRERYVGKLFMRNPEIPYRHLFDDHGRNVLLEKEHAYMLISANLLGEQLPLPETTEDRTICGGYEMIFLDSAESKTFSIRLDTWGHVLSLLTVWLMEISAQQDN